jgi:di/tricarboxylate transporter
VGLLLLLGILAPEAAFRGFANPALLTVGSLFVVAVGIQNTGALTFADRLLFSRSASLPGVLARFMLTTAALSAFLNNTPIVAMLIPRVQAWSARAGISASKLLIPLSYATIVGGMTTLIGTSTNVLVSGLMQASGYPGLSMFDLTWIGLPAALASILYFALIGYRLLPSRQEQDISSGVKLDNYFFEIQIAADAPLIGQSVEEAGLRALREAYLVHLYRQGEIIQTSPETTLQGGDILTFRGNVSILDALLEHPGIERVAKQLANSTKMALPLYEAVVAPSSLLVGNTLRDVGFREHFQGVVLGIQRRDTYIEGPLGNIPIKSGDLLLIEAPTGFDHRWNGNRSDFYLVAPRRPAVVIPQKHKAPLALAILAGIVVLAGVGLAPIVATSFIGALAMLATRCLRGWEARQAIDLPILISIAAALGVGQAIESTGLANAIARTMIDYAIIFGPVGVLAAVYLATGLLTEFITNNAAAALMLSIGLAAARNLEAEPKAFALAVAIAASASFLTPIGYQTNLMVMAAGGYRFSDYLKAGFFVSLIVAATAITMIWLIWL